MMNKLAFTLIVVCILACNSHDQQLTAGQATKIITSELGFPADIIYTIKLADPKEAERCLKFRLDSMGWVMVKMPKDLKYAGQPIIAFTEKAEQFLLPPNLSDVYTNIRRIKVGRKTLKAVSDIKIYGTEASGSAIISYTDFNPLSNLAPEFITRQEELLVNFVQTNSGWALLNTVR